MSGPIGLKIFTGVVVVVVIVAVGYGIFLVGSPGLQRTIKFDERRVSDLRGIASALDIYWDRNEALPESLNALQGPQYHVRSIEDPETKEPYEFRLIEENRYELCAAFSNDSSELRGIREPAFSARVWDHGIGRECFELEAQAPSRGAIDRPHEIPTEGPRAPGR